MANRVESVYNHHVVPLSSPSFLRGNIHMSPLSNNNYNNNNNNNNNRRKQQSLLSHNSDRGKRRLMAVPLPIIVVDPWAPNVDSQSIASQLFAASLLPYLAFLYFITKSKTSPHLTLFGFYFLLAFVAATIPAGIYAKVQYNTSLSNVDWLHGGAESLLTLTNLFIVIGLREAIRKADDAANASSPNTPTKVEKKKSSV